MTLTAYEQIAPRGKQVIEPGKRSAEVEVAVMGSKTRQSVDRKGY